MNIWTPQFPFRDVTTCILGFQIVNIEWPTQKKISNKHMVLYQWYLRYEREIPHCLWPTMTLWVEARRLSVHTTVVVASSACGSTIVNLKDKRNIGNRKGKWKKWMRRENKRRKKERKRGRHTTQERDKT